MYIELDITFLELKVLKVGVLVVGVYVQKYDASVFNSFECPEGVNHFLFSQFCLCHYSDVRQDHTLGVKFKSVSLSYHQAKPPVTGDLSKEKLNRILLTKMVKWGKPQ